MFTMALLHRIAPVLCAPCRITMYCIALYAPLWRAADAKAIVPSDENTELNGSPFKAWGRSVYSHTRYDYCLLISTLPGHWPAFFPRPLPSFFSCVGCG